MTERLSEAAVRGRRLTIDDIRDLPTVDVPTAGRVLGIGRDASYAAAARGELPVLRLGRTLRVPVPALLALLGCHENSEAPSATEDAAAPTLKRLIYRPNDDADPA